MQASHPFANPALVELYLRCRVPATMAELSELNSRAVVPKALFYAAVHAQQDELRNAVG